MTCEHEGRWLIVSEAKPWEIVSMVAAAIGSD